MLILYKKKVHTFTFFGELKINDMHKINFDFFHWSILNSNYIIINKIYINLFKNIRDKKWYYSYHLSRLIE